MSEYRFECLAPTQEAGEQGRAYLHAVGLGFHEPVAADDNLDRWWQTNQADGYRMRAAYANGRDRSLPADFPVATFASFDHTINTGGRLAMANFITDVTVRPTHRRRGLMRQLMLTDLAEAAERGVAFATLTASEGTIYGRFGFGVATRREFIAVRTDSRFRLRERLPERVEFADPSRLTEVYRQVCDQFHVTHTGSHQRPSFSWQWLTGEWDFEKGAPNKELRAALHYAEDDTIDGFVVFSFDQEKPELKIRDLVAVTPEAELGLWQMLGDIDLVEKVHYRKSCPGALLPHALVDPRVVKVTGTEDAIWLRILDVETALAQRGFDHDGELVLGVRDPLGFAPGSYRLTVTQGQAEASRTDTEPDVTIDIEGLGSIYFGLESPLLLAAAGRVTGSPAAVRAFARLFQTDQPPCNLTYF